MVPCVPLLPGSHVEQLFVIARGAADGVGLDAEGRGYLDGLPWRRLMSSFCIRCQMGMATAAAGDAEGVQSPHGCG
jgi:hypothetical protein